ncbi:MAG TPA: PadR family transcriptional regulator [Acidimicrobiales bacterium]|jgi:DNA-binding PadR family transcriptional regulator|nr:PadR family transcriptional regulator [Acidimicrobiales bacterium]
MARRTPAPTNELGRQSEPSFLILTSLASGEKHGYALAKDVEAFSGVALGAGTLYGAIARLEERGLIAPVPSDDRRQPYQLTASGRTALASAVRDMRALADEGAQRLRLGVLLRRHALRPLFMGEAQ